MIRASLLAAIAAALVGCGPRNFSNENDDLRAERVVLKEQIEALQGQVAELEIKLQETGRVAVDEHFNLLPRATSIAVGRPVFTESAAAVVVAVRDGRQRPVQVVGSLTVRLTALGEQPRVLAEATVEPEQLREIYISGLGGTGYRVTFDGVSVEPGASITVSATLKDAITGAALEAEKLYKTPQG